MEDVTFNVLATVAGTAKVAVAVESFFHVADFSGDWGFAWTTAGHMIIVHACILLVHNGTCAKASATFGALCAFV